MDFSAVEALTFDCYGTLIDWEAGILSALRPVLRRHDTALSDDAVLTRYAELESAAEAGAYRPYRDVLAEVVRGFGLNELTVLADSIGEWPPFADTVAALATLKRRFKLGIISNVDDDLFARTARRLEVEFDWIVTAQQAGVYKPSQRPFLVALERMALPKDHVVHVAQSLFHDHVPARELGMRSVWVNRRAGRSGAGATPAAAEIDVQLEVPTLAALAELAVAS